MQKLFTFFFSKNISIYAIFDNKSFNDMLTNDIISLNYWAQIDQDCHCLSFSCHFTCINRQLKRLVQILGKVPFTLSTGTQSPEQTV